MTVYVPPVNSLNDYSAGALKPVLSAMQCLYALNQCVYDNND